MRLIGTIVSTGVLAWFLCVAAPSSATITATFIVLHAFHTTEGAHPEGLTLASDGNVYGITCNGGDAGHGTIFRITPDGQFASLYSFPRPSGSDWTNWDGANPVGTLVQGKDGAFYGVTESGGVTGIGTLFRYSEKTGFEHFAAAANMTWPESSPTGNDTSNFMLIPDGVEATIYRGKGPFNLTPIIEVDSNIPGGLVTGPDGNYYGVAWGDPAIMTPEVFRLTPSGQLTSLHSFQVKSNDTRSGLCISGTPVDLTSAPDGIFYGVSVSGGKYGEGTVFSITLSGEFHTVYSFSRYGDQQARIDPKSVLMEALGNTLHVTNAAGIEPLIILFGRDGNLYGTTTAGGQYGYGTVFDLTTNGQITTLYSFPAPDSTKNRRGYDFDLRPEGLVQGLNGTLYGSLSYGGENGEGIVFKLTIENSDTH